MQIKYDFVVVGAGIAGSSIAYFLRDYKVLVMDKAGVAQKASKAAGAFLFPKVGYATKYTRFINDALLFAFDFYDKLGIDTHKSGVLILPRDKDDIAKFEEYKKHISLPYTPQDGGFFFEDGGFVDTEYVCYRLLDKVQFVRDEASSIHPTQEGYLINGTIHTKAIIFAVGWENDVEYINIRGIWGERIEVQTDTKPPYHSHKNCSLSKNINGIVRIGATHQRIDYDKFPDDENAQILLQKANEILPIANPTIISKKAGMRAASVDYFPVIGEIIDTKATLLANPSITHGRLPTKIFHKHRMYITNGAGARGFSNCIYTAKILSEHILHNKPIMPFLDTQRLFIKWARKLKTNPYLTS
ncbi:MAG: FAD-binding oxidoreductase [Epsilonproteobacteria bacterium]|nr:FAD-binding oxidoreductase [Campylobacterota bacterium]